MLSATSSIHELRERTRPASERDDWLCGSSCGSSCTEAGTGDSSGVIEVTLRWRDAVSRSLFVCSISFFSPTLSELLRRPEQGSNEGEQ